MKSKLRTAGKYRFSTTLLKENAEEVQFQQDMMEATTKTMSNLFGTGMGSLFGSYSPTTLPVLFYPTSPKIKHWDKRN